MEFNFDYIYSNIYYLKLRYEYELTKLEDEDIRKSRSTKKTEEKILGIYFIIQYNFIIII